MLLQHHSSGRLAPLGDTRVCVSTCGANDPGPLLILFFVIDHPPVTAASVILNPDMLL